MFGKVKDPTRAAFVTGGGGHHSFWQVKIDTDNIGFYLPSGTQSVDVFALHTENAPDPMFHVEYGTSSTQPPMLRVFGVHSRSYGAPTPSAFVHVDDAEGGTAKPCIYFIGDGHKQTYLLQDFVEPKNYSPTGNIMHEFYYGFAPGIELT
jgi:hypothetical protein